jgi:nucleoside-diphosphate-sugar epimerase
VVKRLLAARYSVVVLDDFSNAHARNLAEFHSNSRLSIVDGSVTDRGALESLWREHGPFDIVFHLAASIRVQESIDNPRATFHNDVNGTFEVLECCRRQFFAANGLTDGQPFHLHEAAPKLTVKHPRVVCMSTCMVYARAQDKEGIGETHATHPASPYAASKLAAENLTLSYYSAYGMPAKVLRPFNTYGPFQKRNLEGGVVAIFIDRDLKGQPLQIKGDGTQTRDLLYVEDCARFVMDAGTSPKGDGEVLNAGLGRDVSINELARLVADTTHGGQGVPITHVVHDHPQAEIAKLLCNNAKAARVLNWRPEISLEEGIQRTREWIRANPDAI